MKGRWGSVVVAALLVACGPDGEDQSRRDALAAERVMLVEPPGAIRSGEVEQHSPHRHDLTREYGPNIVDRTFEVAFTDQMSVLSFYLDELLTDEWTDVDAVCQPDSSDRTTWAAVVATKRLDGFTATTRVSISFTQRPANVRVTMSAPFHRSDGNPPIGAEPQVHVSCDSLL